MGKFFDSIEGDLSNLAAMRRMGRPQYRVAFGFEQVRPVSATFGSDYSSTPSVVSQVQSAINAAGYSPALATDGIMGPNTTAGISWYQGQHGLAVTGLPDDALLAQLGIAAPPPSTTVKISTVIAALRQAAQESGYTLSDTLVSLMIGQLRGAEGAYPGSHSSLGGTNNMGAAQVSKALWQSKQGQQGWGGFAHYDTDPNQGAYIGWYYVAPSPLEAARYWFSQNWWGPALAKADPQDATAYATILYQGKYFGGTHPGDPTHDPTSDAGQANIADYANAINRGVASAAELADTPDDLSTSTVDPTQFANITARKLTEDLYTKAQSGQIGSAWSYLLPATWDDFVANNGVVWFGPPPDNASTALSTVTNAASSIVSMFRPSNIVASVKAHPYRTAGIVGGILAAIGGVLLALRGRHG